MSNEHENNPPENDHPTAQFGYPAPPPGPPSHKRPQDHRKRNAVMIALGAIVATIVALAVAGALLSGGSTDVKPKDKTAEHHSAPKKTAPKKEAPPVAPPPAPEKKTPAPPPAPEKKTPAPPPAPEKPSVTVSQEQAVTSAQSYLEYSGFSKDGLIEQLKFEKFSQADAEYAVNHVDVNWNTEAVQSAQSYMDTIGGFSRSSLIEQLEFDQYTPAQAEYAVDQVGL